MSYSRIVQISFCTAVAFFLGAVTALAANKTTVHMTSQGFEPREVTVQTGDTVVFENNDAEYRWPASNIHPSHHIYPEFDPKAEIAPGASWEFIFADAGAWKYHDHLFPEYGGTITVTSPESNEDIAIEQATPKFWAAIQQWLGNLWYRITHWGKAKPEKSSGQGRKPISNIDLSSLDQNIPPNAESVFTDDIQLASYLKKYGAKQTILHLHDLQSKLGYCHPAAHRAGHFGYQLLGNQALAEQSPECQSGYFHGVMEAYFIDHGTTNLQKNLAALCPKELNNFFEHQCIHGIGHGLLAWSNYELPEALAACDSLNRRESSCWGGVFMENIAAQIANGTPNTAANPGNVHITKYLKIDDPLYPCNSLPQKYQDTCYYLQPSRMVQLFGPDFAKIAQTCDSIAESYEPSCFASMGREISGASPNESKNQITQCNHAKKARNKEFCLSGAVQNAFWDPSGQAEAITFCRLVSRSGEKNICYKTIFERATQLLASPAALTSFCKEVEPPYLQACNNQLLYAYN